MVRSPDAAGDPIIRVRHDEMGARRRFDRSGKSDADGVTDARPDAIRPFLIGTAVGGVAGAVAGTLLSQQSRRLLLGMIHLVGRRLTDAEREELRFELLLQ